MLQEELRKMQMALAEERKVTEKLSRNLELEKRRSESLEQKVKGAHRRSAGSMSSSNDRSALPEEIRQRADQLADSMEKFRIHCENLSSGLEECEQKLVLALTLSMCPDPNRESLRPKAVKLHFFLCSWMTHICSALLSLFWLNITH